MGTILNTSDGGATWTSTVMGSGPQCHFPSICYYAYLYGVSFVDANTGWVAGGWQVCGGSCGGTSDLLSRTDDGGATWTRQTTPIAYGLHAVAFVDANTGWAVGGLGSIVHTTDGGATWTSQDSQTGNTLLALSFVNASRGTAVGDAGAIVYTEDGGNTWAPQQSGTANTLRAVSFVDANTGIAVGEHGTILRTNTGGE